MEALIARSPAVLSQPTIITGMSGTTNLATTARPLVRAAASTTASLVVASGRSHLITNSGTLAYTVTTTGNSGYTLNPGDSLIVAWNGTGSAHVLSAIASSSTGGGGGGTTSTNLVQTAHGRVTGEIGRPLSNTALFDDTSLNNWPTGILLNIVDTNTVQVAKPADVVTLAVSLLVDGAAFNVSLGRRVWFDTSATLYKQTRQADGISGLGPQLYVLSVGSSTFTALVCDFQPVAWRKFTPFTLTGTHITNEQVGVVPAGVAADLRVWVNGHLVSTSDATFNALTGVLSWTGLALEGLAVEGMWVQGDFEPLF